MYEPTKWQDHRVEYPQRFEMTDGEAPGLVYLRPSPGEIDQSGTPQNAENFNHMENGIAEVAAAMERLLADAQEEFDTLKKIADALRKKVDIDSGNAGTATKLKTSRRIQTNLASTVAAAFDGSEDASPGVTGVLPVANGGTGGNSGITAANTLQVPSIGGGAVIAEGTDLNTLTEPGTYSSESAAKSATLSNTPLTTSGFSLYVLHTYQSGNTNAYRQQIIINGSDLHMWRRLRSNSNGQWSEWQQMEFTDTTYAAMTAATASAAGKAGLVPAPAAGKQKSFLRGDGTWATPDDISGNAATATKLATALNVNGMLIDGSENRTNYAVCTTAAATAAKTVSCAGFSPVTGAEITVYFTVTNTAANPTLNVNGTGAKPIYYRGAAIAAGYLANARLYTFRLTGECYTLVGDINTDTTYANATTSAAGLMSASDKGKLDSLSKPVCYQGSGTSVTKALPAGKTKCLIIAYWAESSGISCGSYIMTGLSSNMTAVTTGTPLISSGGPTLLYTVTSAGAITLHPNKSFNYTMIYFD
ncbi:MAG: pyocin knob domain-containing protein [Butyrivibrio sp.]|nr:pyocin knob domain-containing protein [Butyrivibrio sp.]